MKKLSIIIPVYNTEKYIAKCLNSVCGEQDIPLGEYEVLVVNDGSTDGSREIIVSLQEKYGNILLRDQENAGQSSARNHALDLVQGEYIMFVDADDYLEPNSLAKALAFMDSYQPDLLSYCYGHILEDGKTEIMTVPPPAEELLFFAGHEFLLREDLCFPVPCKYLYRSSFLKEHDIKFLEGIIHEDCEFMPRVMFLAEKIIHWNKTVYWFLERQGSTTRNPGLLDYRIESFKKVLLSLLEFAEKHAKTPQGKQSLGVQIDVFSLTISRLSTRSDDPRKVKDVLSFLKQNKLHPFPYRRWCIGFRRSLWGRVRRLKNIYLRTKRAFKSQKSD